MNANASTSPSIPIPNLTLKYKAERELRFKYKSFLKEDSLPKEAFDHTTIENIDLVIPLRRERIKLEVEYNLKRELLENV